MALVDTRFSMAYVAVGSPALLRSNDEDVKMLFIYRKSFPMDTIDLELSGMIYWFLGPTFIYFLFSLLIRKSVLLAITYSRSVRIFNPHLL